MLKPTSAHTVNLRDAWVNNSAHTYTSMNVDMKTNINSFCLSVYLHLFIPERVSEVPSQESNSSVPPSQQSCAVQLCATPCPQGS